MGELSTDAFEESGWRWGCGYADVRIFYNSSMMIIRGLDPLDWTRRGQVTLSSYLDRGSYPESITLGMSVRWREAVASPSFPVEALE